MSSSQLPTAKSQGLDCQARDLVIYLIRVNVLVAKLVDFAVVFELAEFVRVTTLPQRVQERGSFRDTFTLRFCTGSVVCLFVRGCRSVVV